MKSERIVTVWRLGYIKLFNDQGDVENEREVSLDDGEWRKLFWRIYWRAN